MSTAIAVWSRVLTPGQDSLVSEEVSIRITGVSLEYDESKPASEQRSVLKMQHLTASPALLEAAAQMGYDSSEFDSDEEDDSEIDSDDLPEDFDDEDEDDEEMADLSKISKASSAKSAGKNGAAAAAKKVNGAAEADISGEIEASSDDEDFDEEEEMREEAEVQICSLLPGKVEQFTTDLILPGEEDFVFKLSGAYKVHLVGHYIMQPAPGGYDEPPHPHDHGDEYDSDEYSSDFDQDGSDDEVEADEEKIMELIEDKPAPKAAKKEIPALKKEAKSAPAVAEPASADSADKSKLSKNQLKKLAKKEKDAAAPAAAPASAPAAKEAAKPAAAPEAAKKAPSKKQTLANGLVIEDNKTGTGAAAKSGQRVQMRYIGRLSNGKIFDQNTKGAPFSFKLGKGEVIKGWDVGIAGMQVGGERKLIIPASLAYGKQAISGIPPNSTLTFEVKLLAIK